MTAVSVGKCCRVEKEKKEKEIEDCGSVKRDAEDEKSVNREAEDNYHVGKPLKKRKRLDVLDHLRLWKNVEKLENDVEKLQKLTKRSIGGATFKKQIQEWCPDLPFEKALEELLKYWQNVQEMEKDHNITFDG